MNRSTGTIAPEPRPELSLSGGRGDARVDNCFSLLARGKAERDNAGCGDDIVQCLLAPIRNHEAFRISVGPKCFDYGVPRSRKIKQLVFSCLLQFHRSSFFLEILKTTLTCDLERSEERRVG